MTTPETPAPPEAGRIRWEPNAPGGWCGYVATMEPWAFQIWHADAEGGPWRLDSTLLGQFGYHVDHPDPEALKLHAERWLAQFTTSIGAVFPKPAQMEARPDRRKLRDTDVLDAFRTVTNWSDAEVLHYETCDQCSPEAGLVCDVIAAELAAAMREADQ